MFLQAETPLPLKINPVDALSSDLFDVHHPTIQRLALLCKFVFTIFSLFIVTIEIFLS